MEPFQAVQRDQSGRINQSRGFVLFAQIRELEYWDYAVGGSVGESSGSSNSVGNCTSV